MNVTSLARGTWPTEDMVREPHPVAWWAAARYWVSSSAASLFVISEADIAGHDNPLCQHRSESALLGELLDDPGEKRFAGCFRVDGILDDEA